MKWGTNIKKIKKKIKIKMNKINNRCKTKIIKQKNLKNKIQNLKLKFLN